MTEVQVASTGYSSDLDSQLTVYVVHVQVTLAP
jgi:hypothetical protein